MLVFHPDNHLYESIDKSEKIDWISVTTLVSYFKQPFDSKKVAEKVSKNKKSKWYGMTPEQIITTWNNESKRATDLGTWYHNQREADLLECETLNRHGVDLGVFAPNVDEKGVKTASSQKLDDGIYPEHLVYLKTAGICGQSDLVEIANGCVHILDYKTNKEIKTSSFVNWEGLSQKMGDPISHLDDCNYFHYALQLSIYMYMIIKHNPKLKPGSLILQHVVFETEGEDEFGYPITKRTDDGEPVVKDVIQYQLPYLKEEVHSLFSWLKFNKHELINYSKKKKND
jgi:hypothetical protein